MHSVICHPHHQCKFEKFHYNTKFINTRIWTLNNGKNWFLNKHSHIENHSKLTIVCICTCRLVKIEIFTVKECVCNYVSHALNSNWVLSFIRFLVIKAFKNQTSQKINQNCFSICSQQQTNWKCISWLSFWRDWTSHFTYAAQNTHYLRLKTNMLCLWFRCLRLENAIQCMKENHYFLLK